MRGSYHGFFKHHHLSFDGDAARQEFQETINRIFRRNGLAYELDSPGRIERLAPPVLREDSPRLSSTHPIRNLIGCWKQPGENFWTLTRRPPRGARDSMGRIGTTKTLGPGPDKKAQVSAMLDAAAGSSSPKFREALETEARELTSIGNSLQIRHSETTQERIARSEQVDYLFHRLFSLIQAILHMNYQN